MGTGIRFSHVVANVSDPDRAADFWEIATTLRRESRTPAPEQSFASLDIPRGRFDGWLMRDPNAPGGPAIHLCGWRSPDLVGQTYPEYWHVGLFRICTGDHDAETVYRDVLAAGGRPFTDLIMPEGERVAGRPSFCVPDADGVVLQHVTTRTTSRLSHIALNPRDLARSMAFYEALGLKVHHTLSTEVPVTYPFGPGRELSTFEAAIMQAPDAPEYDGRPVFCLDLCRWKQPEPIGEPYRAQNNRGLVRLGLAVDDLAAARAELVSRGVAVSAPETRDFGGDVGVRSAIVFRDPDGVVVEIFDRPL